jgi:hypothetical protein
MCRLMSRRLRASGEESLFRSTPCGVSRFAMVTLTPLLDQHPCLSIVPTIRVCKLKWQGTRIDKLPMLSSPQLTSEAVDLDELRARLRKMSDADLTAFAKPAR